MAKNEETRGWETFEPWEVAHHIDNNAVAHWYLGFVEGVTGHKSDTSKITDKQLLHAYTEGVLRGVDARGEHREEMEG